MAICVSRVLLDELRTKRGRLSHLAPSVTRVAICVSRVLLDELQNARILTLWRCHQSITTAARKRKLEYSIKCTTFSATEDFFKSRAQGLSPPSNEDNTVAKNEGFILTPRVLFGRFFLFLVIYLYSCVLVLSLWVPCFVLLIPQPNAPFLVPGFSGKKQPRRQCLLESEKTLGTSVGRKMG